MSNARRYVIALGIYLCLTVVFTAPALLHINHAILGQVGQGDLKNWINEANLGNWFSLNPFRAVSTLIKITDVLPDRIAYFNIMDLWLDMPLRLVLRFPADYNLMVALILLFNACTGFVLLYHITKNYPLALMLGAALAFNPVTIREINFERPHLAILGFVYLLLWSLYKMKDERRLSNAVYAGAWFALTCLTFWFYGLGAAVLTALFCGFSLVTATDRRDFALRLALMALIGGILIAPWIMWSKPFITKETLEHKVVLGQKFPSYNEMPHYDYPAKIFNDSLSADFIWRHYAGLLALALIPLCWRKKLPGFELTSLAVFYVLCLGPFLKYQDSVFLWNSREVNLPYQWAYFNIPFFSRLHQPHRLEVFVLLALVLLAAGNMADFSRRLASRTARAVCYGFVLVLLGGSLAFQGLPFKTTYFDRLYPFYAKIPRSNSCLLVVTSLPDYRYLNDKGKPNREEYYMLLSLLLNSDVQVLMRGNSRYYQRWFMCYISRVTMEPNLDGPPLAVDNLGGGDCVLLENKKFSNDYLEQENNYTRMVFARNYKLLRARFGMPLYQDAEFAVFNCN